MKPDAAAAAATAAAAAAAAATRTRAGRRVQMRRVRRKELLNLLKVCLLSTRSVSARGAPSHWRATIVCRRVAA